MQTATRRAAACDGGAAADNNEDPFFRRQFEEARTAAADVAGRLSAACLRNAPRDELDRLAQRVAAAVAELRIAIQAARLAPRRGLSPPLVEPALLLALTSAVHLLG